MRAEKVIPPELFKEEYEVNGLKLTEMGKKYGFCRQTMIKLKEKYGYNKRAKSPEGDELKLRPSCELRIALIDKDLSFTPTEIDNLKELWEAGIHFTDMAAYMKRHYLEVLAILTDMLDKNELSYRKNGVFGEVG